MDLSRVIHGQQKCLVLAAWISVTIPIQLSVADEIELQAIGSLAAAHVYTSYGYVGVTADAFVADSFTRQQVNDLMNEVSDMIDLNVEALQKVREHVGGDDREFLDDLIDVYGLVRGETIALVAYARSKEPDDAAAFEKARKAVWPKLKVLLGIE